MPKPTAKTTAPRAKPTTRKSAAQAAQPVTDASSEELNLLAARSACLINVANSLNGSDEAAIDLLCDIANGFFNMTKERYAGCLSSAYSHLDKFQEEQDVDFAVELKGYAPEKDGLNCVVLADTTEEERTFLGECLYLKRNYKGNAITPLEDFIINQINLYAGGIRLTPDLMSEEVNGESEGYRGWFRNAVAAAKHMQANFPKLVAIEEKVA